MMPRRTARGLTLLETLLALSMLSLVAGLVASMTATATRSMPEHVRSLRWEDAATATLRDIDRALQSRDRSVRVDRSIVVAENTLSIARPWGSRVLINFTDSTIDRVIGEERRTLLGSVRSFDAKIAAPDSQTILTITIESFDGETVARVWDVSP